MYMHMHMYYLQVSYMLLPRTRVSMVAVTHRFALPCFLRELRHIVLHRQIQIQFSLLHQPAHDGCCYRLTNARYSHHSVFVTSRSILQVRITSTCVYTGKYTKGRMNE